MSAEQSILAILREEIQKAKEEERADALIDMSVILTWLTFDPPLSHKKLTEYCVNQLNKSNKYSSSRISYVTNFYKSLDAH